MKNQLFLLAAIALTSLTACNKNIQKVTLGEPFELAENTAAKVKKAKTNITFLGVENDSRCPTGANCVWEGQVTARLLVNADTVNILMRGTTQTSENVGEYDIQLLEVNPYPSIETSQDTFVYSVKLQVDEQASVVD